jgi:hypothetical protein
MIYPTHEIAVVCVLLVVVIIPTLIVAELLISPSLHGSTTIETGFLFHGLKNLASI